MSDRLRSIRGVWVDPQPSERSGSLSHLEHRYSLTSMGRLERCEELRDLSAACQNFAEMQHVSSQCHKAKLANSLTRLPELLRQATKAMNAICNNGHGVFVHLFFPDAVCKDFCTTPECAKKFHISGITCVINIIKPLPWYLRFWTAR